MRSRVAYSDIAGSGVPDGFDETVKPVWDAIVGFYERDARARCVDPELVQEAVRRGHLNPKRGTQAAEVVRELWDEEVSVENVRAHIVDTLKERAGMALASAIAGRKPEPEIAEALEQFQSVLAVPEPVEEEDTGWAGILRKESDPRSRMLVSPRVLNQHIRGGVLPGHNVTIFGRPESGKTALAITMACGFARRGHKVLYVGNEDPIQALMVRAISNLTDKTADELAEDPAQYERLALEKGAANLVFKSTAPGTMREVEALVKLHKPAVLFVDQLRNITGTKAGSYTELLDKNAQGVRALGKKYGMATVSITQAGDSASGKAILDMGDVDSSNTGIPGAADLMIGVGVTDALDMAGQRMLSLPKNKLGVVKAQVVVHIDPFRSKMK
jgi:hypothetical protein